MSSFPGNKFEFLNCASFATDRDPSRATSQKNLIYNSVRGIVLLCLFRTVMTLCRQKLVFLTSFSIFLELVLLFFPWWQTHLSLVCDRFQRVTQCRWCISHFFFGVIAKVVKYDARTRWRKSTSAHCPKVYRIGGQRFSTLTRSTTYLARDYSKELKGCFGVSAKDDVEGVHPSSVNIRDLPRVVSRFRKGVASSRTDYALQGGGCGEIQEWTPHCINCLVCSPTSEPQSMRGRPKEEKIVIIKCTHQESSHSPLLSLWISQLQPLRKVSLEHQF